MGRVAVQSVVGCLGTAAASALRTGVDEALVGIAGFAGLMGASDVLGVPALDHGW